MSSSLPHPSACSDAIPRPQERSSTPPRADLGHVDDTVTDSVLELAVGGVPLARRRATGESLDLERYLAAVVIHRSQLDDLGALPVWAAQRVIVLDTDSSTRAQWASAARAAEQMR